MIRVVIADDHLLVRQGIRVLLEKSNEIEVIGEAATGEEAVAVCAELNPDVVLMDVSMPRMDGIQATRRLMNENHGVAVLALSMHSDAILVKQMLYEGAKGYVLKNAAVEELRLAIQAASHGHMYLSPNIASPIFESLRSTMLETTERPGGELTPREREVLQLIVEGHTNLMISDFLSISPKTVEKHRASIMQKLDVRDVASLVRTALKHKLVVID